MAQAKQIARFLIWALVFWMSFAFMMAWEDRVRVLQRSGQPNFLRFLLIEGSACLTFALLTPAIFVIVRRYPVTRQTRIKRSVAYVLGALPFIIAFSCLRWSILSPWSTGQQAFVPRTFQSLLMVATSFADQTWTYLATVVAAHAYTYMQERLEFEQALVTSELQFLKSQIHPHFLFNTLHSISALIDSDRNRAKSMIVMVSNLLRGALKQRQMDLIALQEELNFVEDYLAIEKVRLGERLEVRWEVPSNVGGLLIPQLILQPLVENAIQHGIACCREGGWIQVIAVRKHPWLEIQITNSMCGQREQQGMGVGLENVRGRLSYLYGSEAEFKFQTHDNQVATAFLRVPALESAHTTPARDDLAEVTGQGVRNARPDRG